jgi:hypothetical protein
VEFHNPSADHVNLGGLEFQGEGAGEPFLFPEGTLLPPRGYLVLCSDPAAFQVFFPQVQSLIGGLEFPLSDAGETIQVRAPNDQVMDAVGYDDDPPWPLEPGGSGPTLELISPLLDNALPASWAASVGHGTPGALNSASSTTGTLPDPGLPAACALLPAWPNPFNGGTTLAFVLDRAQRVRLSLCDVAGRYVALVADRRYEAGKHVETWNGCDAGGNRLSSGLYLVRMQTAAGVFCRKLLLIK